MKSFRVLLATLAVLACVSSLALAGEAPGLKESIFDPGKLAPIDSKIKVKVGDPAPNFVLPLITGGTISLAEFKGKKNVAISFIPAAWTPVCSGQWPGYNIAKDIFEQNNTILIGVSVDNIPTLYSWVKQMGGLWFPVASDFWPHGAAAAAFGVLRSSGVSERALLLIDKAGIIRYIGVGDINVRPDLGELIKQMQALPK